MHFNGTIPRIKPPIYTRACRAAGCGLIYVSTALAWLGLESTSMQVGLLVLRIIERGERHRVQRGGLAR